MLQKCVAKNGRHKNSAESENAPYISVTIHHMKTNNGSTSRFSGRGIRWWHYFCDFKLAELKQPQQK